MIAVREFTHPNGARERHIFMMGDDGIDEVVRPMEIPAFLRREAPRFNPQPQPEQVEVEMFPPPEMPAEHIVLPEPANETVAGTYFVMRRTNGAWDIDARPCEIIRGTLEEAEACALKWAKRYPAQTFGTATLVSEARAVENPLETVKLQ